MKISILRETFELLYLFKLISGNCETIVLLLIPLRSDFIHLLFFHTEFSRKVKDIFVVVVYRRENSVTKIHIVF